MKDAQSAARLHVLMARHAPYAVIIRRGPAKSVCTVGWDRIKDTFEVGQWLRGRIYEKRADLSPDGRHLIYFAGNFIWNSETKGTWTAISRAPYLKAISIWAKGDTYFGGGVFLDNKTALLHGHHGPALELSPDIRIVEDARGWSSSRNLAEGIAPTGAERVKTLQHCLSARENAIYEASLQKRFGNYRAFEDYRAGWRLDKHGEEDAGKWWNGRNVTKHWWLRRPRKDTGYQLIRRGGDTVIDLPPGTGWADADNWGDVELLPERTRIVWALEGRMYAAEVTREGVGPHKMLYDFNPMTFEALEAPYSSARPKTARR
jgi:hypothetical protein